jgi:four helix bundle protein
MRTDVEDLKIRTKQFAVQVIRGFRLCPGSEEGRIIGRQLLRSGTSVAANYRAACRARSRAEFVAKLGIVVEEIDETVFWLELLEEAGTVPAAKLQPLRTEAGELFAIFTRAQMTAKRLRN